MKRVKQKLFGKNVGAFYGIRNDKPGNYIAIDDDDPFCTCDWLSIAEAKRLHAQLGKAIAYVESERKPKAGKGSK